MAENIGAYALQPEKSIEALKKRMNSLITADNAEKKDSPVW